MSHVHTLHAACVRFAEGGRNKRKCDIPATHWNTASKEDQEAVEAIMRDLAAAGRFGGCSAQDTVLCSMCCA